MTVEVGEHNFRVGDKPLAHVSSMQRTTGRGGKETNDRPRPRTDDVANDAAGSLLLEKRAQPVEMWILDNEPLSTETMEAHEFVEAWYANR